MMKRYFKIWLIFARFSFESQAANRGMMGVFLLGKFLRFGIFLVFILVLLKQTKALAGYDLYQTLFFFLTFNLIDITAQLFFREVYRFRSGVVTGAFDFSLLKPLNPLFRSLTSGPDLLDLITLIPLVGSMIYLLQFLSGLTLINILVYILLIISGLTIALSIHILVLSLAVVTTEIDHAVMIYRDLSGLGRMPIDIFKSPLKEFLTFLIPVGIMMSFPVKALLGLLSPELIVYSCAFAIILFYLSTRLWDLSLKNYSSAGG